MKYASLIFLLLATLALAGGDKLGFYGNMIIFWILITRTKND